MNPLEMLAVAGLVGAAYNVVGIIQKRVNALPYLVCSLAVAWAALTLAPQPQSVQSAPIDEPTPVVVPGTDPGALQPLETESDSQPTTSPWRYITDDVQFGCAGKEDFSTIVGFAAQGDREAYVQAITEGFMSGVCRPFKTNQKVYVEGGNFFGGLVKLRVKGETSTWWTNIEATKPNP